MMRTNQKNHAASAGHAPGAARTGLTTLEFVACTVAVVGGTWLGLLYMGVDVRHLAYTALTEAELIDNVPPKWRPAAPEDDGKTRQQLVAALREELASLRNELAALRSGRADVAAATTAAASQAPAIAPSDSTLPQASKDSTLAYWQRISDITLHEAALQHDAELASNEQNAAKVFSIKSRISRFAAKSVDVVPRDGVDDSVLKFGRQLAVWYEAGGELYDRAAQIWESPVDSQSREQLNREWRQANLHHRNQSNLLSDKAAAVRHTVSRTFRVEFPEFAKPVVATATSEANTESKPETNAEKQSKTEQTFVGQLTD